ncbi:FCD domain-containing protein [Polycladidibacter stylochi]|uniref:FCD domain-containing protein n=1 Tax=Polycladidibacter stylochi TaxID=1807766 RepID=UPI0008307F5B|nr:FCD domain-containing protein [Pseudovibrio stylochi]
MIEKQEQGESTRASGSIVAALISDINNNLLADGHPMPTERELCERFDASRTVVREALLTLQLKGYMDVGSGRRPRVTKPSLETVVKSITELMTNIVGQSEAAAQLEQLRLFLECGAIREVTGRATNLQIARIKQALEENYQALGNDNFVKTDVAFHRAIIEVVSNPFILAVYDNFLEKMIASRPEGDARLEHERVVYQEHLAMYEAILNGNGIEASELMRKHLERSYRARLLAPTPLKA